MCSLRGPQVSVETPDSTTLTSQGPEQRSRKVSCTDCSTTTYVGTERGAGQRQEQPVHGGKGTKQQSSGEETTRELSWLGSPARSRE